MTNFLFPHTHSLFDLFPNMNSAFSKWSRVGLGTGTLASIGRGTTKAHVRNLLSSMQEIGVTVIDTADSYTSGRCENLLGQALHGRRDDFVVVTKAGYRHGDLPAPLHPFNPFIKKFHQKFSNGQCHTPAYLSHCLHRSLRRLKLDHVDAFLLHDPSLNVVTDLAVQASLAALQAAGKTLHLGVSSESPDILAAAIQAGCFSVIQTPANPTTIKRLSPICNLAEQNGIHLMANHVFFSGNTSGYQPIPGESLHESLLKHACRAMEQGTILVGTRNPMHLKECAEWARYCDLASGPSDVGWKS
jgi:aryl-alcohol dehydrogenase-like predicted oxidoreductase